MCARLRLSRARLLISSSVILNLTGHDLLKSLAKKLKDSGLHCVQLMKQTVQLRHKSAKRRSRASCLWSDGGGRNAAEHSSATFNANCAAAQDRSGSEFLAFRKYFERPDRIKVVKNVSWFPLCELSVSAV
jgi:hypothetical protein